MGFLDAVTSWFKREASDVKASVDQMEDRFDAELTRRERELDATPKQRMEMIQAETASDDALDEIQSKIDSARAHADATADVIGPDADEPDDVRRT